MASDAATWREQEIETNGVRLHVVTRGESGPLVILLHGFPECWYSWREYLPALAEAGFRAVAPDMRGYNLSEKPKGTRSYDLPALTADVMGLIRAFGEEKAVIVGHDWGANVAWRFAMDYPQAVEKLVICNVPHPARFAEGLRTLRQLRKSWYVFFFQLPWLPEWTIRRDLPRFVERGIRGSAARKGAFSDEDIRVYTEALRQPGALTAGINYYRAVARWGQKLPIKPITTPTLIIWGEEDRFLGKELVAGTERFVPDLLVQYIPHCGHWVQQEARVETQRALLDFLCHDGELLRAAQTSEQQSGGTGMQAEQRGINAYRFVEQWFIPFPPEEVWDVVADGKLLPEWWKGVYLKAEPLEEYGAPRVGAKLSGEARGFLPYHLRFTIESIELERPRVVMVRTVGDLTGTWRAEMVPEEGGTRVHIEERVLAEKPILKLLSPLLKPLFAANHRWTTPRGEAGLTAYLRSRQEAKGAAPASPHQVSELDA